MCASCSSQASSSATTSNNSSFNIINNINSSSNNNNNTSSRGREWCRCFTLDQEGRAGSLSMPTLRPSRDG